MTDLDRYSDSAVLTAAEIAEWLGVTPKVVYRLPMQPLSLRTRPRRYLASEVKRVILGGQVEPSAEEKTPVVLTFTRGSR